MRFEKHPVLNEFDRRNNMIDEFLKEYFPEDRVAKLIKEICSIKMKLGESVGEYWDRYKRLIANWPQHGQTERPIMRFFYVGMTPIERRMVDNACGGHIRDKTPVQIK